MRLRFPGTARLARSSEFARVRADGRAFHGKAMVVSVLKEASTDPTRIGFITSRRVGSAVIRSRARRRLRELVRADRPQLAQGCWVVVIAKSSAATLPFKMLQNEWRSLAKRAGILILEN
jgi:ribonuclease P protein component